MRISKSKVSILPALMLGIGTVVLSGGAAAQSTDTTRPNVVMFYTDDLGYGDLSCYGATRVKTPNIDKLADNGLKFTNAHCATATCTPSRFAILTGQYPWRKSGTAILPGNASLIIPTNRATLGTVFQNAGYKTAIVGKWHLGLGPESGPDWNGEIKPGPNEVGFDYSFIFPATADRVPTVYVRNHRVVALDPKDPIEVNYKEKIGNEPTGKENPDQLKMTANRGHDNTIVNGIGRIGWMTGGQRARWADETLGSDFSDEANDFIARNSEEPFFLFYAMHNIHVPRVPDVRFKGQSPMGYRGDAILEMDYLVGKVMDKLDAEDLTTNTIVMFSSDNGAVLNDGYDDDYDLLGDHKPSGPFSGGKYSIFEGGTRVPFIVHWPAGIKPGETNALVGQLDLVRSFAAFTGQTLDEKDAPDSQNIIDALLGKSEKGRESLVEMHRTFALVRGDWKYIEPRKKNGNKRSGVRKYVQLYNLKDDPAEQNNLAKEKPELVKELRAELEKIKADGGVAE